MAGFTHPELHMIRGGTGKVAVPTGMNVTYASLGGTIGYTVATYVLPILVKLAQ